jgi:hypothetical protein
MPMPMGPKPPMTPGGQMPPRPSLPGSPFGGPSGPGSSPATSPGAGAGNEAAADATIKGVLPVLHRALLAYQVGSKKYNGLLNGLRALTANFGKEDTAALAPAAGQQIQQAAKGAGPLAGGAPPPGLAPAPSGPSPAMNDEAA